MTSPLGRPSVRARIVSRLFRRYVKPRSLIQPDVDLSREMVGRFSVLPPIRVRVRPARDGEPPGEWIIGRNAPVGTLLYLHGGAYVLCSPETHRPITAAFARRGFRVFAARYRLAPEHPFPAALDDAVSAYRSLLDSGSSAGTLVLAGDSAGGGLVLAMLLRLRDEGLPMPAGAVLFSPWADLSLSGDTLRTNEPHDVMFHNRYAAWLASHYLGGSDPADPYLSPVFGDFRGLPPLMVHVGGTELLLDDARRVAERAQAAGVRVALRIWADVPHGWQIFVPFLPEARRSIQDGASFLRDCIRAHHAQA